MIFDITLNLFSNIEHRLLKDSMGNRFFNYFKRQLWLPFKMINQGMSILSLDIGKFTLIMIFGGLIVNVVKYYTETEYSQIFGFISFFLFFIAIFSTIFSTPSTLSPYGVKKDDIKIVVQEFNNLNIIELTQLNFIYKNIIIFETKFKQRTLFYRALLILSWSWNTYLDQSIAWIYVAVACVFFVLECYIKGGYFIFKSIEFGKNEIEYNLSRTFNKTQEPIFNPRAG